MIIRYADCLRGRHASEALIILPVSSPVQYVADVFKWFADQDFTVYYYGDSIRYIYFENVSDLVMLKMMDIIDFRIEYPTNFGT